MKLWVGMMATCFMLLLIQGGASTADTPISEQNEKGDRASEEALLTAILNDVANAETQFSKTKDSTSILRFYTQDYAGINDGKLQTVKDFEQYLAEMLEQINSGEPIGVSSKFMNITSDAAETLGWATYEYEYKIVRSGVLQRFSQGFCTAIFRKQGDSWLIRHKHCSPTNPPTFLHSLTH